jgi:hypothetical protein
MPKLRQVLNAARAVAIVALVALFVKVAPTLATHAAGHATTYSGGAAAASPRGH